MGSQDCVRYIYNGECLLVKEIFVKKSKIQKEYNTEHYDPNRFIPKSQVPRIIYASVSIFTWRLASYL